VQSDHSIVTGQLNIEFDCISALLVSQAESRQRIFRRVMRCAAMRDNFHEERRRLVCFSPAVT
jgi:hypothetical protein